MRGRLGRLFWIGAAALLGAAALVAIVAVLRGELTETDGRILTTLGAALATGGTALAGLALVERRTLSLLGWATVAAGVAGFAAFTYQIWRGFPNEEWAGTTLVIVGVLLLLTTARLLLRPHLAWLFAALAVVATLAGAGTIWMIWADETGDAWGRLLAALWILTGLAWFLVPVLGRSLGRTAPPVATTPAERVVARGPGRHEVELAEGEELVVRRR